MKKGIRGCNRTYWVHEKKREKLANNSPVLGGMLLEADSRSGAPKRPAHLLGHCGLKDLSPIGKVQVKMAVAEDFHLSHQGIPPLSWHSKGKYALFSF